jgi:hypothetical protein
MVADEEIGRHPANASEGAANSVGEAGSVAAAGRVKYAEFVGDIGGVSGAGFPLDFCTMGNGGAILLMVLGVAGGLVSDGIKVYCSGDARPSVDGGR